MPASRNETKPHARFLADESGATVAEFATLAPLFFGLIYAVFQVGLYFYFSASLANATNGAARQIMTGQVANTAKMSADMFRNTVLCPLLPGSMSCSNIITNVLVVPWGGTFYNIPPPAMDNTQTSFCIGSKGSYVIVQVYYAMPVMGISMMMNAPNYNGVPSIFINANSVFVNEPFTSTYKGDTCS